MGRPGSVSNDVERFGRKGVDILPVLLLGKIPPHLFFRAHFLRRDADRTFLGNHLYVSSPTRPIRGCKRDRSGSTLGERSNVVEEVN